MKTDTYTKIVLTVIALLLAALVVRPSIQPVHAAAATTKYSYVWNVSAGLDKADIDGTMRELKTATENGCEVIAIFPVAGPVFGGSGTKQIMYICRKPQ